MALAAAPNARRGAAPPGAQVYAEDILTLNEGAARFEDADDSSPHLMPIALQFGDRGPEVSNLQTEASAIFHAVRCGFAQAYDLLAPLDDEQPDGWEEALRIFPDSVLEEAIEKQRVEREAALEKQRVERESKREARRVARRVRRA